MSTLGDLSINAKITVSQETAERCIQLLNIFLEDNPHTSVEPFGGYSMEGKPFKGVSLCYHIPGNDIKETTDGRL